eukprot:173373-Prorocentrum_minimum.AAC.3
MAWPRPIRRTRSSPGRRTPSAGLQGERARSGGINRCVKWERSGSINQYIQYQRSGPINK